MDVQNLEKELEQSVSAVKADAEKIVVKDQAGLDEAGEFLLRIKDSRKQVSEAIDPAIKSAHDAHKKMVALKKKIEAPLIEAEGLIKRSIADYHVEIRRKREAEESAARAEAERIRKEEEDERLKEAEELESAGRKEEAEAALNRPIDNVVPIRTQTREPEKVSGVSVRTVYDFEIVDVHKIPREFMVPDERAIRAHVQAKKDGANLPGIRIIKKDVVLAGRR